MLVLLRSILDGTRRKWYVIVIGMLLGAAASALAGETWHDSRYVFWICGAAAVMAENLILGVFNASKEFRDHPIKVVAMASRIVFPWFSRTAISEDINEPEANPAA